jgi:hypothetical protein
MLYVFIKTKWTNYFFHLSLLLKIFLMFTPLPDSLLTIRQLAQPLFYLEDLSLTPLGST